MKSTADDEEEQRERSRPADEAGSRPDQLPLVQSMSRQGMAGPSLKGQRRRNGERGRTASALGRSSRVCLASLVRSLFSPEAGQCLRTVRPRAEYTLLPAQSTCTQD